MKQDTPAQSNGPAQVRFVFIQSRLLRRTIVVLAIGLGLASVGARIGYVQSPRGAATDYSQDYLSAKAWNDGRDPYADTGVLVDRYFGSRSGYYDLLPPGQVNPHPPLFILLNRPLAHLPYRAARTIWLLLSAAFVASAVALLARKLGASPIATFAFAIGSLAIPVVQTDLVYGQINGLLLLLLVGAWISLERDRDGLAGALLGIASSLKLFPILMIIFLLRAKRIRAALWQVGTAVAMTLLGGLVLGLHATADFFLKISPANLRYWRAAPMNLSLFAIPFRWLTRSPWRTGSHDLVAVAATIAVILIGVCIVAAFRSRGSLTQDPFWETVPWMLLITPIVWETYLVLLIPFLALMFRRMLKEGVSPGIPAMVAAVVVMIGLVPNLPRPLAASNSAQLLGYSLPTYGLLVLAVRSLIRRDSVHAA